MPEVKIRPAVATDVPILMAMDHSCESDYVWQMEVQHQADQVGIVFREIRLPRSVSVPYPRPVEALSESWSRNAGMLVAVVDEQVIGYGRMSDKIFPQTAWLTDVVVAPRYRRQAIGTALLLAAQSWAAQRKNQRILFEMSSKNSPAIRLAQKLGYEFCGYNDNYYGKQDIALFFGRLLR